jgi:methyl-accepting chemotaxis protein
MGAGGADRARSPSRRGRQTDGAAPNVRPRAGEITRASAEQAKAAAQLAKDAEDVRRVSRQTARAAGEQESAVATLAASATRNSTGIASIARATTEQAAASEQITRSAAERRGRHRNASRPSRSPRRLWQSRRTCGEHRDADRLDPRSELKNADAVASITGG